MEDDVLGVEQQGPVSASLSWAEACDLLGGAGWDQASRNCPATSLPGRSQDQSEELAARFSSEEQFLFCDEDQTSPLESLWLKWCLFSDLCSRLQAIHQLHKRPHLNLHPEAVRVLPSPVLSGRLPIRWGFTPSLEIEERAPGFASQEMPVEMARSLFATSIPPSSPYASPIISEWPLGRQLAVTLLIRSLDRIPDELEAEPRALLRVHVVFDGVPSSQFSERDVFRLTFRIPGKHQAPVELWARKVEAPDRGIVVSGVSQPMPAATWDHLERVKERVFSDSTAAVFRAFEPHHDLYSLGMLLVRALLVNEAQGLEHVSRPLKRVLDGLDPVVRGLDPDDPDTVLERIRDRLDEEGPVFRQSALIFAGHAREDVGRTVPDDLWYEALTIAVRLLSEVPEFSFGHGARRPNTPGPLDEAVQAVEALGGRIRHELFGSRRREREISEICAVLREELTAQAG